VEVDHVERLTVVIANYNYERYVGAAIESALALKWPDVEVVVVDDGSTDGSIDVLRRYSDRVMLLLAPNGGQRVAANRGFAASSGDVVIFLDADDLLPPELPLALARAMTPTVSKVQFQMQRIDESGRTIGSPFPKWEPSPSPGDVRRWVTATSAYPTPPGSGNAYARWFLERIFPLDATIGDFADSGCLAAAPFHGNVVSLPGVAVGYRQHGMNDSNLLADRGRFSREVVRARARWRFARRSIGVEESDIDDRPLRRSRELLQFRIAAARLTPHERSLPGDGRGRLLIDALRSPLHPGPESMRNRVLIAGWCIAALVAPEALVWRLVRLRWRRG
jgi:glycosyltransferase involved in cell wall biosynthesis